MKKLLIFIAIFGLIFSTQKLFAQNSYKQVDGTAIKESCINAQSYINQTVRKNDLRTRVDRLQLYEYNHQYLDLLTTRLENNSQPQAQQMRDLVDGYKSKIDGFKAKYEEYDSKRDKLAGIGDCQNNTAEFAELLQQARSARQKVATSVKDLKEYADSTSVKRLNKLQGEISISGLNGGIR